MACSFHHKFSTASFSACLGRKTRLFQCTKIQQSCQFTYQALQPQIFGRKTNFNTITQYTCVWSESQELSDEKPSWLSFLTLYYDIVPLLYLFLGIIVCIHRQKKKKKSRIHISHQSWPAFYMMCFSIASFPLISLKSGHKKVKGNETKLTLIPSTFQYLGRRPGLVWRRSDEKAAYSFPSDEL